MLIIIHLSLMIAAVLCLITGVSIAMFGRKKKTWLKLHKGCNSAGFCLLVTGAVMAFASIATSGGNHLAGLHQWIGLAAFVLTGLTAFLGFYSFKAANKPPVRTAHRWLGRISLLLLFSAITAGLKLISVI